MTAQNPTRRQFHQKAIAGAVGAVAVSGGVGAYLLSSSSSPRVTFCGAAQRVSGSCYHIETGQGSYLVDCGLFFPGEGEDADELNRTFPYFNPSDLKAVFLTHAHLDHNGRLPLLYKHGFRGKIYATDCSCELTQVMLKMSSGIALQQDDSAMADSGEWLPKVLQNLQPVPYHEVMEKEGIQFRFTDAGHILGSAMIELWVDGRKLLFSGDMGPDFAPLLRTPQPHRSADLVLVESTYGACQRTDVDYEDFGKQVMNVIRGGGSVLLPAFVLHKTQTLIYMINVLKQRGIIEPAVPVYADSSTARKVTQIYHRYAKAHRPSARRFGEPFYRNRYFEVTVAESISRHKEKPAIYIASSGMLDHAAAPRHLLEMATNPKNAVVIVGWQAPGSLGDQLLHRDQAGQVYQIPNDTWTGGGFKREILERAVYLQVSKWKRGFSSHAAGEQILDWVSAFEQIGPVCVVHGEPANSKAMAEKITEMGLNGMAVAMGETITVGSDRERPGTVPNLAKPSSDSVLQDF